MSDTLTTQEEVHRPHEITVQDTSLHNSMFGIVEEPKEPTTQTNTEPATTTQTTEPTTTTEPATEPAVVTQPSNDDYDVFDEASYLKERFGWDSADVGKKELEALRERANALELTNEESKKIFTYLKEGKRSELYQFLHEQERVEKLITSDLSDKNTAAELVKFSIASKNKNLKADEVDFLFNERFAIPEKPAQGDDLDEDYAPKLEAWKRQVENIEKRLVIEAKLAQPELEKLKSQLVLPDIQLQQPQKRATQEELDAAKRFEETYLKSVDESLKGFNGFSVKVKNEAVGLPEITIAYGAIDTEKSSLSQQMADFAKEGFNTNALFAERWVNEDGSLKTSQIIEDRYLLANKDKIFQKMTEDAANKAIDAYIKGKKNIDIKQTQQQGTAVLTKEDKTEFDLVRDSFFS